jgi:hypothetical protein
VNQVIRRVDRVSGRHCCIGRTTAENFDCLGWPALSPHQQARRETRALDIFPASFQSAMRVPTFPESYIDSGDEQHCLGTPNSCRSVGVVVAAGLAAIGLGFWLSSATQSATEISSVPKPTAVSQISISEIHNLAHLEFLPIQQIEDQTLIFTETEPAK